MKTAPVTVTTRTELYVGPHQHPMPVGSRIAVHPDHAEQLISDESVHEPGALARAEKQAADDKAAVEKQAADDKAAADRRAADDAAAAEQHVAGQHAAEPGEHG